MSIFRFPHILMADIPAVFSAPTVYGPLSVKTPADGAPTRTEPPDPLRLFRKAPWQTH